tara:strand:- start:385 stop:552 length:168 start_codon:yes stop_codon:yes gene_type:complete
MTWVDNKNYKHKRDIGFSCDVCGGDCYESDSYQGVFVCDECLEERSEPTESDEKD